MMTENTEVIVKRQASYIVDLQIANLEHFSDYFLTGPLHPNHQRSETQPASWWVPVPVSPAPGSGCEVTSCLYLGRAAAASSDWCLVHTVTSQDTPSCPQTSHNLYLVTPLRTPLRHSEPCVVINREWELLRVAPDLQSVTVSGQTKLSGYSSTVIIMTDTLPDQEPVLGNSGDLERMEDKDKDEMFVSAMDSPTDSGLDTNKTSSSDTMEDLSLQVRQWDIEDNSCFAHD